MQIQNILIQNFKSIKSFSLSPKKVTMLVGHNGTGKSSVLEAVRYLLTGECPESPVASGETSLASNNSAEEATGLRRSRSNQMINLNGKRYTATDVGSVMGFVENVSAHGNQATVPDIVIPPFVLRTVTAYNGTNEQFIEEMGADSKTSSVYESGGAIAYHHAMFAVTESGTILCLAVDAIYPRVDIAMAGSVTSYEYSLDDGITWEAATEGFVFRQVEHVMLRNAGGSTIHIGTSEGANDICTLTSNQYVAYSTENTTWYVSEEA